MLEYSKLLENLEIGNSVAEFDNALERYFVETGTFRAIVRNERDIIAGDKGTGKSALFKILQQRHRSIPELKSVEIIPAFNVTGNPAFQRLAEERTLTEAEYITVWKSYVLSLIGNWLLEIYKGHFNNDMRALDDILTKHNLRDSDNAPAHVFARIVAGLKRYFLPKSRVLLVSTEETTG